MSQLSDISDAEAFWLIQKHQLLLAPYDWAERPIWVCGRVDSKMGRDYIDPIAGIIDLKLEEWGVGVTPTEAVMSYIEKVATAFNPQRLVYQLEPGVWVSSVTTHDALKPE